MDFVLGILAGMLTLVVAAAVYNYVTNGDDDFDNRWGL